MSQRPKIFYSESQITLMWGRWQLGESLHQIGDSFIRLCVPKKASALGRKRTSVSLEEVASLSVRRHQTFKLHGRKIMQQLLVVQAFRVKSTAVQATVCRPYQPSTIKPRPFPVHL